MNRKEEYTALLAELESAPDSLEYTLTRAKARMKKSRRVRRFFIPVSSLAAVFAAFILTVNLSTTFALACKKIPVLRDMAAAVDFSPSLSAAVKNDYVQPIGLEQTGNNITMRIEYVIVDQTQLNVFYTLDSELYKNLDMSPAISNPDGSAPGQYFIGTPGGCNKKDGDIRYFTVTFVQGDMPGNLVLTCDVCGSGSSLPIHTFTFTLTFNPNFTQQGKTIDLNQDFTLDNQNLTVTTVDVYPTHILLNLAENSGNTKWLTSMSCYMEDEKGSRFDKIKNGLTSFGSKDSPMAGSFLLESSYFSDSNNLTLYITGAVLLDKNMKRVKVDLVNGTAKNLPNDVTFEGAEQNNSGWEVTFTDHNDTTEQLFSFDYYDESGNKYSCKNYSIFTSENENANKKIQFTLTGYQKDIVYLCPDYSDIVTLDSPIAVTVK